MKVTTDQREATGPDLSSVSTQLTNSGELLTTWNPKRTTSMIETARTKFYVERSTDQQDQTQTQFALQIL